MKTLLAVSAAALVAAASCQQARAGDVVAYLADYTGETPIITRNGDRAPGAIGEPLMIGDMVTVKAGSSATIDGGDGVRKVTAAEPFRAESPKGSWWSSTKWREIAEIVRWHGKSRDVSARTREGYSLSAPMLEGAGLKLVAGRRSLRIGLVDGKPPFKASVTNNGAPAGSAKGDDRWLDVAVALTPGPVTVTVEDVAGKPLVFKGEVVKAAPGEAHRDTPFGRIEAAADLSRVEGGAYAFEAAQIVARPDATRAELAMRDAFLIGDRP